MKLKSFLLLLILFTCILSYASKTVIKGSAKAFAGKEISISIIKDYISNSKEQVGFSTISNNGNYQFEFDVTKIETVTLKIEDKTTWFFVEPGKVYNLNLSYDKDLNKQRIYDKQLSLFFNFPAPNELNQQIKKFNNNFDQFINDNIASFKKRDRSIEPKLEAFKAKTLKETKNIESKFVKDFINYSFASTQNSLDVSYSVEIAKKGNKTKADLYIEYLDKKPILYNNPEYIKFYKTFFKGELKDLALKVKGMDITKAINDDASFNKLSEALSKYPFLQDDEFKNLFILNGLLSISKDEYFTKTNVVKILKDIELKTKYPEQKIIATNMIQKVTSKKFGEGSKAPDFELKNQNGELVTLADFKGKPVYINFWANWSIPSQKEMKIMQSLHKEYKNKIHFVSICADNDYKKMSRFLSKNEDYSWEFLHIGINDKLLEKYSIRTYPTYVLLDEKLIVYQFPAARPGGTAERATELNIEKIFYEMIK